MFDIVKNTYQNDIYRPHIFGSLGTITGKNKESDRELR